MSKWVEIDLYPDEPTARTKTRHWRLKGEVQLSLRLDAQFGSPRFEITRILEDADAVRQLALPEDVPAALERISRGEVHIDEPVWHGSAPNQLRGYCREKRLPTPEGYAKAWREMRSRAKLNRQLLAFSPPLFAPL